MFFTIHHLGGWLAQVTTFTAECLKTKCILFLNFDKEEDCFHPHTFVFENPGCKELLYQMAYKYKGKYFDPNFEIEHIDITSYLSAPNRFNSCKKHVGTVYRIFPDLSDMGWLTNNFELYNFQAHDMDEIVKFFDLKTGQVIKDNEVNRKIKLVIDWPIIDDLPCVEYERYFKRIKHFKKYHPDITEEIFLLNDCHTLRYQTETYE